MDDLVTEIEISSEDCVRDFVTLHGIEYDDDNDIEDLRALAISLILSTNREDIVSKEFQSLFPESSEVLNFLLESTNNQTTTDLINQLIESEYNPNIFIKLERKETDVSGKFQITLPKELSKNTHFITIEDDNVKVRHILCNTKIGVSICRNLNFGYHKCKVSYNDSISCEGYIFVSSCTYEFLKDCDDIFDVLTNGWNLNTNSSNNSNKDDMISKWTNELENSLLELLVCANDELQQTLNSWKRMMSMMRGLGEETDNLCEMIREDITKALSQQSSYAVGRLHQNLLQLVDSGGGFLNLPDTFVRAVHNFLVSMYSPLFFLFINHNITGEFTLNKRLSYFLNSGTPLFLTFLLVPD